MSRALGLMLLGLLLAGHILAQTPSVQQQLITLENAWNDAVVKKDRAALERIMADDYSYTESNGSVLNKTQEIAETMSDDAKWNSAKLDDVNVRVFGDVAIVTGRVTLEGAQKGYVSGPRRFTDVFVKRAAGWQVVAGEATLIPPK